MRSVFLEAPCRSALNPVRGMDFSWSLNPYMGCAHRCTYCYVRAYELRADRPADDRYGDIIRVKTNVAEVLGRELDRPGWLRETVVIGAATDPYQPAEGRYRLTRACIVELAKRRNPLGIITRGPLIVRDVDVLRDAARRGGVSVNISIPTLDEDVWRRTEPATSHPRARLRALRTLAEAGIRAGVGIAPILPGISDSPEQIASVVRAAREAGAAHVWCTALHLRPGTREHFMRQLARDWPEELARYERMYAGDAYLGREMAGVIKSRVETARREAPAAYRPVPLIEPPEAAEQLDLAL